MRTRSLAVMAAGMVGSMLGGCLPTAGTMSDAGGESAMVEAQAGAATGVLFESVDVGRTAHKYAVYVPRDYTPDKKWPVIVFMNGSGECGTDGQKQLAVGLMPAILFDAKAWPFIVVFPQKPSSAGFWADHDEMVMATIKKTQATYSTDTSRLYLTGLSQGGKGTWDIAAKHPEMFAAIAPVCGWGDANVLAPILKNVPVWAFHGEKDDVVKPKDTKEIVEALQKAGGKGGAKVTMYPDANHNSWDKAYREKLGAWFLEHSR